MLKTMQKHGVTLAIFAAVLTGLTALVNNLTKSTIDEQAVKQQKALFDQVIPLISTIMTCRKVASWSRHLS